MSERRVRSDLIETFKIVSAESEKVRLRPISRKIILTAIFQMRSGLTKLFTTRCNSAKRGLTIACRPSVRPSVCNVGGF